MTRQPPKLRETAHPDFQLGESAHATQIRLMQIRLTETVMRLYRDATRGGTFEARTLHAVCDAIGTQTYRLDNLNRVRIENKARHARNVK